MRKCQDLPVGLVGIGSEKSVGVMVCDSRGIFVALLWSSGKWIRRGLFWGSAVFFELHSFIMSCDLEAEAKKKFKVPETLSSNNYSPES